MNTLQKTTVWRGLVYGTLIGTVALALRSGPPVTDGAQAVPVFPTRELRSTVWGHRVDYIDPLGRFAVAHGKIILPALGDPPVDHSAPARRAATAPRKRLTGSSHRRPTPAGHTG